ncbi:alpha/beta hydrolase [Jatrophihabitans sp. DSM 45814]
MTKSVPYDPELQAALVAITAQLSSADLSIETIAPMRDAMLTPTTAELSRGGTIDIDERVIPDGLDGADLVLSIFRRAGDSAAPPATIYAIHGGGMIVGNRYTGVESMLDWVQDFGLVVVSVEYRLAPENQHPIPVEDCYAGLVWVAKNASELGIDPQRIAVMGGSAGGGLAAAVAILARDRGGPALIAQVLVCPMLDDRNETPSSHQYEGIGVWDRRSNELGWTALLGEARGGPDVSPYAAPARLVDFSGLPPAYIDVGSAEVFRDEDVQYALGLWAAGVQAELHVWAGGFHGFDGLAPHAAVSMQSRATRTDWLKRTLGL